jgi:hypothetical protein
MSHSLAARRRSSPRSQGRGSRRIVAGVAVVLASLFAARPAIGDPDNPPPLRTVLCECEGFGSVELVASHGNAIWIGSQLFELATITPPGGETQTFGVKAGFGDPIACRSLTGSGITLTLVAVPAP